jgi:lysophospholipase L1-like esterase
MADEVVFTGTADDNNTGDPLRQAMAKINQRFVVLAAGQSPDAQNIVVRVETARDGAEDAQAAAEAAQASALTAEAQAEAARDAAFVNANVYASTAAGLAAVALGGQFLVVSADGLTIMRYRHDAGPVATLVASYASANVFEFALQRSGYWGGWITNAGRMGIAFRDDNGRAILGVGGDIHQRALDLEAVVETSDENPRSGILLGFRTAEGRLLGKFDARTGRFICQGRDALEEISEVRAEVAALSAPAPVLEFPSLDWACWGDSLTGAGSSGDWPSKLATALGRSVYNGGIGGQGVRQIAARQGGIPALLTVSGGSIPASGGVSVTSNAYFPASNGGSVLGTLAGVPGTYSRNADGTVQTFTRAADGEAVPAAGTQVFTPSDGVTFRDRTCVFWLGRNSFKFGADQNQIIQCIRAMADYLSPRVKRFLVMEIPPSTDEINGSADRVTLNAANDLLRQAFPDRFVDVASWLRTSAAATAAGITFTSEDNTDIANGVTPASFRSDALHFSQAGGDAIRARIILEATNRGWIAS